MPNSTYTASTFPLRVEQAALMMLRFCNLATILNLLMITINEFLYIKWSFKYTVRACR
jgi:hypothetical protein